MVKTMKKLDCNFKLDKKQSALLAIDVLNKKYPKAECALEFKNEGWRLMVMGRLSAQCTDKRVNIVCEELFKKYPTAKALGDADIEDIENIIRPCGLFRTKARDIVGECKMLTEQYNGCLPDDIDTLLKFPGVGRKIASLLVSDIYGKPAIVADTHCIRISGRLGLADSKDPYKVELSLKKLIPEDEQSDFCHRLVMFGREVCDARNPKCTECPLTEICKYYSSDK